MTFKFLIATFILNLLYSIIFPGLEELKNNSDDYAISFQEPKDNRSKLFIYTKS